MNQSSANLITSDKKKSAVLSVVAFLCLILALHLIRFWPPLNVSELLNNGGGGGGVTINFGDTDFGSNANVINKVKQQKINATPVKEKSNASEELITATNSTSDLNLIAPKAKQKIKKLAVIVPEIKPIETKTPTPKKIDDAVANLLKGKSKDSDGTTTSSGNQGRSNGAINSGNYSNDGSGGGGSGKGGGIGSGEGKGIGSGKGNGSGSGYTLGNRKALSKPTPNYTCNEEGKVVVEISVNRNGQVISAKAGVQGSTNTANCLLSQAKMAALNTKWESSAEAPDVQIGKIVYNFSLN